MDALYLMTTSLKGSVSALLWSMALLLLIQMIIAFVMQTMLFMFYFHHNYPDEDKQAVFSYFGSFARSLLTMFEMTLANWPPVCRLLVENVSEWFMIACLIHKITVGFAFVSIINGVFMQETFRVASTDDRVCMRHMDFNAKVLTKKMHKLFKHADESGDGFLQMDEFRQVLGEPEIVKWLRSMELRVEDVDTLFRLVDADG